MHSRALFLLGFSLVATAVVLPPPVPVAGGSSSTDNVHSPESPNNAHRSFNDIQHRQQDHGKIRLPASNSKMMHSIDNSSHMVSRDGGNAVVDIVKSTPKTDLEVEPAAHKRFMSSMIPPANKLPRQPEDELDVANPMAPKMKRVYGNPPHQASQVGPDMSQSTHHLARANYATAAAPDDYDTASGPSYYDTASGPSSTSYPYEKRESHQVVNGNVDGVPVQDSVEERSLDVDTEMNGEHPVKQSFGKRDDGPMAHGDVAGKPVKESFDQRDSRPLVTGDVDGSPLHAGPMVGRATTPDMANAGLAQRDEVEIEAQHQHAASRGLPSLMPPKLMSHSAPAPPQPPRAQSSNPDPKSPPAPLALIANLMNPSNKSPGASVHNHQSGPRAIQPPSGPSDVVSPANIVHTHEDHKGDSTTKDEVVNTPRRSFDMLSHLTNLTALGTPNPDHQVHGPTIHNHEEKHGDATTSDQTVGVGSQARAMPVDPLAAAKGVMHTIAPDNIVHNHEEENGDSTTKDEVVAVGPQKRHLDDDNLD